MKKVMKSNIKGGKETRDGDSVEKEEGMTMMREEKWLKCCCLMLYSKSH